jgi:uncharacterized protein
MVRKFPHPRSDRSMSEMPRFHARVLGERLAHTRQMVFVSGPPQVGKSTSCRALASGYVSWDSSEDRRLVLSGAQAVARFLGLERPHAQDATVVFDNLCRYRKWMEFLHALRLRCGPRPRFVVTGSAAPDIAREGSRALAGRWFHLRVHPWSVSECVRTMPPVAPVQSPECTDDADWAALVEHGGFPEPFLRRDPAFTRDWQSRRRDRLIGEELHGLAPLQDPVALRTLAGMLAGRSSVPLIYSEFARELGVTVETISRWVDLLARLHYGFCVRPWFANLAKALRREPKWFLRDWSEVSDTQARQRTFVACHLLKSVQGWTDLGLGRFELRYVRDKLKREVDFLVMRNAKPWFLVEVGSDDRMGDPLGYFQANTGARHAFHVVFEGPFVNTDCFAAVGPLVVPARTLLSQLL